jgi:glycosyltransferase involved in cell wall biosynthesis
MSKFKEIDVSNWELRKQQATHAAYGWLTMLQALVDALARQGVTERTGADIVLQTPTFDPRDWSREEWIFALTEFPKVPENYARRVNQADALMVPNHIVGKWFKNAGVSAPTYHCPLGFDAEFDYAERPEKPDPIRFLWLGAFTNRKMWIYALHAFWQAFSPDDQNVEFYVKTTTITDTPGSLNRISNFIFDNRNMSRAELRELYQKSHVFVHTCTMEGFGLPPLEAMGTGALVLSVSEGGLRSFINTDTAWVIPTVSAPMIVQEVTMRVDDDGNDYGSVSRYKTPCWKPDTGALSELMLKAVRNYGQTAKKREAASQWAHNTMTWDHCARRFAEIINEKSITLNNGSVYQPRKDPETVPHAQILSVVDPDLDDITPTKIHPNIGQVVTL